MPVEFVIAGPDGEGFTASELADRLRSLAPPPFVRSEFRTLAEEAAMLSPDDHVNVVILSADDETGPEAVASVRAYAKAVATVLRWDLYESTAETPATRNSTPTGWRCRTQTSRSHRTTWRSGAHV